MEKAVSEWLLLACKFLASEAQWSKLMINRAQEHCAVAFGIGLYDVAGRISYNGFHEASSREISFMKKSYIPRFQTEKLENYLIVMF